MDWVQDFQLFLFDFDGILVNTEDLHYQAYQRMCRGRGCELPWDFPRYCQAAHFEATGLRDQIYTELPQLKEKEPDWSILYEEKKAAYVDLVNEGAVTLMPGVEKLLRILETTGKKRCVVTHSPEKHVSLLRKQHPILDSIPHWFTREHYSKPKPDPQCYLMAIEQLSEKGDHIIGFEDTPRGLQALQNVPAQAAFITNIHYPTMNEFLKQDTWHFTNFPEVTNTAPQ
jgi:beta-phosphoglucomutase